ncbi:TIGR02234 family membrane protein [Streptomyces diacarni]|uniref:TIGR02234 family membrane protein n=1 Tax=Streptomyces diacarni TaxID=2800381 RepID=UPI0033F3563F
MTSPPPAPDAETDPADTGTPAAEAGTGTPAAEADAGTPAAEAEAAAPDTGTAAPGAGGARSRAPRVALAAALLCGAVGAALALVAAGQTWSESSAAFAQGTVPVSAEGGDVTGLPSALALVGLAALVAVFAVRRLGRYLVAGLLTVCGGAVMAAALLGADDTAPLTEQAAKTSGLTDSGIGAVDVTAWPYVSAAGGALLLLAGLLALRYGRTWPSMSGSARYERVPLRQRATRAQRVDPDRPEDLWKAMDRGEDPTHGTA